MDYAARIDKLVEGFSNKADAFMVTELTDIRYLTGFTGSSAMLFVTNGERLFITDFRYEEQAREQVGDAARVVIAAKSLQSVARRLSSKLRVVKLGFDSSLSFAFYDYVKGGVGKMVPFDGLTLGLRALKDADELVHIRQAVKRAEDAFMKIKPTIRAGVTEKAIAARLGEQLRKAGSASLPFEIIVASGPNSSRPHAGATGRKLCPGDLLTIDWGAECEGYFSDMTRTFLVKGGRGAAKKKEIHSVVNKARAMAIKAVRPGVGVKKLDAVARDYIAQKGYGKYFGHGLGHGVGLDVHELPRVSKHAKGRIRASEVFTIEPGVYLTGVGGVRIEDMVVAQRGGCEVLTSLPRAIELI